MLVLCPSLVTYAAKALMASSLMGESSGVIKDYKEPGMNGRRGH